MAHTRRYICLYIYVKKFSSFRIPVTFDLLLQTRSGFETEHGERKTQKNQRSGGLRGVMFKFVIPRVQVYIKLLQLVQLSGQQDGFRAGQVPLRFSK